MKQADKEVLLDRWMNDPGFRAQMRQDAVGAVKGAGIVVDEEDVADFQATDWTLSDEELAERISKRFRFR